MKPFLKAEIQATKLFSIMVYSVNGSAIFDANTSHIKPDAILSINAENEKMLVSRIRW